MKVEAASGLSVRTMPVSLVPKVWMKRAHGKAARKRGSKPGGIGSVP